MTEILALTLSLLLGISYAGIPYDCVRHAIDMEKAISIAREHTGKPFKAWISRSRKTGKCFWKIRGMKGYIMLDANSGEIIKFYRNRK